MVVLGSTGSIGTSTLDVLSRLRDRFQVVGLSAGTNFERLCEQAVEHGAEWIAIQDSPAHDLPNAHKAFPCFAADSDDVIRRVQAPDVDIVVSAVVGAAGFSCTWAALEAGKTVALANKESLVVGGPLVMDLARKHGGL